MKYKLINIKTKEEHLCDKVTIDGFDYYVSNKLPKENDLATIPGYASLVIVGEIDDMPYSEPHRHWRGLFCDTCFDVEGVSKFKKVIATNNPNIDIPQIVNEVEILAKHEHKYNHKSVNEIAFRLGFEEGYNKAKEQFGNSDEDMIEFYKWVNQPHPEDNRQPTAVYINNIDMWWYNHKKYTSKEMIQLFKEQKPKIIYYVD